MALGSLYVHITPEPGGGELYQVRALSFRRVHITAVAFKIFYVLPAAPLHACTNTTTPSLHGPVILLTLKKYVHVPAWLLGC